MSLLAVAGKVPPQLTATAKLVPSAAAVSVGRLAKGRDCQEA